MYVVQMSGGVGSFAAALRIVERYGRDCLRLLFTDTLIEDKDLYRFLIEGASYLLTGEVIRDFSPWMRTLPEVEDDMLARKAALIMYRDSVRQALPGLIWIADGRDPWEVYRDERFLGNSRIAPCSHILKQKVAGDYIRAHHAPDDTTLVFGIDWSEAHRTAAMTRNWAPYACAFPLTEPPYRTKADHLAALHDHGIEPPALYGEGFPHNNCGGFCVRAGHGAFGLLRRTHPERFAYHRRQEEAMQALLDAPVTILSKTINGRKVPYSLADLEADHETGQVDMFDLGGCGCFVEMTS